VFSQTIASIAQSLRITTADEDITIKAYSDTNQVTQIGNDIVYTATGAVLTPRFGISVNPSAYNQGFDIDEITID
jgi:hypothetical protein